MRAQLLLSLLIAAAGSASVYLAAQHQAWRARPWPALPARVAGALLLAAALAMMWHAMQPVAAVFTWSTWLMLLFALFPALGALRGARGRKDD